MHVEELTGVYFAGHHILRGILDTLDVRGLAKASEIVLTGNSAGGMGTFIHADWVFSRYLEPSWVPLRGI